MAFLHPAQEEYYTENVQDKTEDSQRTEVPSVSEYKRPFLLLGDGKFVVVLKTDASLEIWSQFNVWKICHSYKVSVVYKNYVPNDEIIFDGKSRTEYEKENVPYTCSLMSYLLPLD